MDLIAECVPKIFIIIKQSIKDGSWLPPDICAPIAGVSATLRTAWVQPAVLVVTLLGWVNFATLTVMINLPE